MRLSAKTEYATIAILELARSYGDNQPVQIRRIAEHHDIPQRFLVQILLQLKAAGVVTSTRGATGGYQLAKEPKAITLWDVISVIEGPDRDTVESASNENPLKSVLGKAWERAFSCYRDALESVDFAKLVKQAQSQQNDMYYI